MPSQHGAFGILPQPLGVSEPALCVLVCLGLAVQTADAQIYKCLTTEGSTTYQEFPCAEEQVALKPPLVTPTPPGDPGSAQGLRQGELDLLDRIEEQEQRDRQRRQQAVEQATVDTGTYVPDTSTRVHAPIRYGMYDHDLERHLHERHRRELRAARENAIAEREPKPRRCAGACTQDLEDETEERAPKRKCAGPCPTP